MSQKADLHIHTHFSDGTQSPAEVVKDAHARGLKCIAITDHDTVDGIAPTMEVAKEYDIEVIAGIELSCEANGRDVHVLGYLFDYTDKRFLEYLDTFQNARVTRMEQMIEKLQDLGIDDIGLEEVCSQAKSKAVGRPHLASKLVEKGHVSNIKDAFNKYLADDAPAYVDKFKQSPKEAIDLINSTGGIAVLAHPMVTQVDELIPQFVQAGLGGIEVYYPNTANSIINFYEGIAKKHSILVTGGSDAHGAKKKNTYIGKKTIPYSIVEQLKAHAGR